MTVPTTKPIDWPDWGAADTFTYQGWGESVILTNGQILAEFEMARFPTSVLILEGDGDGSDWAVTLQWMTKPSAEGGSVIYEETAIRIWPVPVVIPMTNWAPILRIIDAGSTVYPHSAGGTFAQFSTQGKMAGWPGGITVYTNAWISAGSDQLEAQPRGCAPGPHQVLVATQSTAFDVLLRIYSGVGDNVEYLIGDETTDQPITYDFIAPASAWDLLITNSDASPSIFNISVNRVP